MCELGYDARTRERLAVRGPLATAWFIEPNAALHLEPAGVRSSRVAGMLRDAAHLGYRGLRRSHSIGRASVRGALAAFADALRDGAPFSPGLEDGVRNAQIVAAALHSAAHGGAMTAPTQEGLRRISVSARGSPPSRKWTGPSFQICA